MLFRSLFFSFCALFAQTLLAATVVTTAQVKQQTFQKNLEAVGTARASESVTISATVTERIRKINFDSGQWVKKGAVLVELDATEQQALLREAQAKLEERKKQYDRTKALSKMKYLSLQEHDTRLSNLLVSRALVNVIKSRIADRTIKAPFSGILGLRHVSVGAVIEPGNPIVTLDKIDPMKVDFSVPERYLRFVKPKQQIQVTSQAYPDKTFKGEVKAVDTRIDANSRTVKIRGLIQNPKRLLKPGMLLHINLKLPTQTSLFVPEAALVPSNGSQYVYVVDKSSIAQRRKVVIGLRRDDWVQVLKGLKLGENVVVDGAFKLKPGMKVVVQQ